jgi:hypothetical protein
MADGTTKVKGGEIQFRIIPIYLGLISSVLFALGSINIYWGQTAPAAAALGFAFLLVTLMLLAKFKRFKGFGFEAEMWEEEQIKAAELAKQLEDVASPIIDYIVMFAANFGLNESGLRIEEKEDLLARIEKLQLEEMKRPGKVGTIVSPDSLRRLTERLCRDYCWWVRARVIERLHILERSKGNVIEESWSDETKSTIRGLTALDGEIWLAKRWAMDKILDLVKSSSLPDRDKMELSQTICADRDGYKIRYDQVQEKNAKIPRI